MPEGVGVESEQFTAQHKRAILVSFDLSLLFALSQQFIIGSFGECKGVPDTTPTASAPSNKNNLNRFSILNNYMFWS